MREMGSHPVSGYSFPFPPFTRIGGYRMEELTRLATAEARGGRANR